MTNTTNPSPDREKWLWWHRWKRHTIHKGYGLLSPATAYHCEECDKTWVRSWI